MSDDTSASSGTPTAERASWAFSLAMGATTAAIAAFILQLAVVPTALVLVGVGLLVRLDAPTGRLARRLIIRFETDVTEDSEQLERRPRAMLALYALFPLALAINAWESAGPDDQWNTLAAAITALGCWVGWSFAEHGRQIGRPLRWFPYWLALSLAIGGFHTVGGPFHVRWASCESKLTDAVQAGEPITSHTTGWMCWPDAHVREVNGETRLYLDGGIANDNGEGLAYSPDGAIEAAPHIKALRDLGDGWYWFETGSALRFVWFDG